MTRLRNTTASNRNDSTTTRPMNKGSLADKHGGEIDKHGGRPPDVDGHAVPTDRMREWSVVRRWSIRWVVAAAWGALVG